MTNLIDEITQELIGTIGTAVKDLKIEDIDGLEYENICSDFNITLDVAQEVFPKALAKAKAAVEEIEAEIDWASMSAVRGKAQHENRGGERIWPPTIR